METQKDIANAELVEIRKQDGAQKYKLDRIVLNSDIAWISGWPKTSNVAVGDKGKIVYRSNQSWGLHFFIKNQFVE